MSRLTPADTLRALADACDDCGRIGMSPISDARCVREQRDALISALPDLTGAATGGVILGMVPGLRGVTAPTGDGMLWSVTRWPAWMTYGHTLAEAAAVACVAAGRCA